MPLTAEYTKRANKAYYERVKNTDAHKLRNLANIRAFRQRQKILKLEATALMLIDLT